MTDSPDVYLEPKSLHRFFTERIYRKLQGNAYFGYEYDEGFLLAGNQVQIEVLKDFSRGACCQNAYRIALEQALQAQGLVINPRAPHQIGVSIVGVERQETPNTLPGRHGGGLSQKQCFEKVLLHSLRRRPSARPGGSHSPFSRNARGSDHL